MAYTIFGRQSGSGGQMGRNKKKKRGLSRSANQKRGDAGIQAWLGGSTGSERSPRPVNEVVPTAEALAAAQKLSTNRPDSASTDYASPPRSLMNQQRQTSFTNEDAMKYASQPGASSAGPFRGGREMQERLAAFQKMRAEGRVDQPPNRGFQYQPSQWAQQTALRNARVGSTELVSTPQGWKRVFNQNKFNALTAQDPRLQSLERQKLLQDTITKDRADLTTRRGQTLRRDSDLYKTDAVLDAARSRDRVLQEGNRLNYRADTIDSYLSSRGTKGKPGDSFKRIGNTLKYGNDLASTMYADDPEMGNFAASLVASSGAQNQREADLIVRNAEGFRNLYEQLNEAAYPGWMPFGLSDGNDQPITSVQDIGSMIQQIKDDRGEDAAKKIIENAFGENKQAAQIYSMLTNYGASDSAEKKKSENRTIDGDSFVRDGQRYRMENIDAPESGQAYGPQATAALSRALSQNPSVTRGRTDPYGRTLTRLNQGAVGNRMIRDGAAWGYDLNPLNLSEAEHMRMLEAENEAAQGQRGVWGEDAPLPPWIYRALK